VWPYLLPPDVQEDVRDLDDEAKSEEDDHDEDDNDRLNYGVPLPDYPDIWR
jgi:hypothetical protein